MKLWFNVCHLQNCWHRVLFKTDAPYPLYSGCSSDVSVSANSLLWLVWGQASGPEMSVMDLAGECGPHVWLCSELHCVSTHTGWWVGSHIQRNKEECFKPSSPHAEGKYAAFGGNFLLRRGLYLTLIWWLLFYSIFWRFLFMTRVGV